MLLVVANNVVQVDLWTVAGALHAYHPNIAYSDIVAVP